MKTYLVTGAAGFIGANYIKYILAKHNDIKVVILDALTYAGNLGTIANDIDDERCFFVKGDICDRVLADDPINAYALHETASHDDFRRFMREQPESYLELAIQYWHNGFTDTAVNLLKEIKRFNEEYSWDLGQNLFASSTDDTTTREKATTLLRELIKSMDAYSGNLIRLADFFDLKFRVIENRNDTGFVERLTNVGSEGTDILVKSMVNIMLLNVFKRNASTVFSDFRLHCMMDEIGKLHPNTVAGILKFANDRDILLINGSPTEQDALSYKHIYKLEKDTDSFTRIRRVITQFD